MSRFRKESRRQPKRGSRESSPGAPLANIISLRVSDEEMAALTGISRASSKSISDIMREALRGWQSQRRRLCLDI